MSATVPGQLPPPPPVRETATSSKRAWWAVAALALIAVLAVGYLALRPTDSSTPQAVPSVTASSAAPSSTAEAPGRQGPEPLVQEYLQALADGDALRANEIADPGVSDGQDALLTNEALADAERIRVIRVGEPAATGDESVMRVPATVALGSVERELEFEVRAVSFDARTNKPTEWQLETSLTTKVVLDASTVQRVRVGNVEVPTTASDASGRYYAYPGIYPISLTEQTAELYALSSGDLRLDVYPAEDEEQVKELSIGVTPSLHADRVILEAANAFAERCVETQSVELGDVMCPVLFRNPDVTVTGISRYASTVERFDGKAFVTGPLQFATTGSSEGAQWDTINVLGEIRWADGEPYAFARSQYR